MLILASGNDQAGRRAKTLREYLEAKGALRSPYAPFGGGAPGGGFGGFDQDGEDSPETELLRRRLAGSVNRPAPIENLNPGVINSGNPINNGNPFDNALSRSLSGIGARSTLAPPAQLASQPQPAQTYKPPSITGIVGSGIGTAPAQPQLQIPTPRLRPGNLRDLGNALRSGWRPDENTSGNIIGNPVSPRPVLENPVARAKRLMYGAEQISDTSMLDRVPVFRSMVQELQQENMQDETSVSSQYLKSLPGYAQIRNNDANQSVDSSDRNSSEDLNLVFAETPNPFSASTSADKTSPTDVNYPSPNEGSSHPDSSRTSQPAKDDEHKRLTEEEIMKNWGAESKKDYQRRKSFVDDFAKEYHINEKWVSAAASQKCMPLIYKKLEDNDQVHKRQIGVMWHLGVVNPYDQSRMIKKYRFHVFENLYRLSVDFEFELPVAMMGPGIFDYTTKNGKWYELPIGIQTQWDPDAMELLFYANGMEKPRPLSDITDCESQIIGALTRFGKHILSPLKRVGKELHIIKKR